MKKFSYTPKGVCSRQIEITLDENDIVCSTTFTGGCSGNAQGVAALCQGRAAADVIRQIKGIRCGMKDTSCPDQLALALQEALDKK